MLRERGLNATSLREVAKQADAAFGSTYHYFPGGKQQMIIEAVKLSGSAITGILRKQFAAGPVEGLKDFLSLWREALIANQFRAGCPVLAVSAEAPQDGDESILVAAAEVFDDWEALLTEALAGPDGAREETKGLATLIVASVEGAIAMCRAKRSIVPFDLIAIQLTELLTQRFAGNASTTQQASGTD